MIGQLRALELGGCSVPFYDCPPKSLIFKTICNTGGRQGKNGLLPSSRFFTFGLVLVESFHCRARNYVIRVGSIIRRFFDATCVTNQVVRCQIGMIPCERASVYLPLSFTLSLEHVIYNNIGKKKARSSSRNNAKYLLYIVELFPSAVLTPVRGLTVF